MASSEPSKTAAPGVVPAQSAPSEQRQQLQPPAETEGRKDDPEQPASPPLPARPTAATPGPRATRLQELYASSLAHTLGRISWDNFAACYPTVAARAPDTLRHVQRQMVDRLGSSARNVVAKLNELETLVSEAALRKDSQTSSSSAGAKDAERPPTPPHLLPASDVLAAHMAPHLAAHQSQLNARLQTVQSHNAALWEEVATQRAEVAALLDRVEKALADVDGASGQLDGVAGELAGETRAVEVEMGGM